MNLSAPVAFILSLLGGFLFPWWWPAVAAYAAAFWLGRSGGKAFVSGFAGAGAAWMVLAAFMDWRNGQILSTRVAALFHLPHAWNLLVVTGVIGGLLGGFGAWAGQALRRWLTERRQSRAIEPF